MALGDIGVGARAHPAVYVTPAVDGHRRIDAGHAAAGGDGAGEADLARVIPDHELAGLRVDGGAGVGLRRPSFGLLARQLAAEALDEGVLVDSLGRERE